MCFSQNLQKIRILLLDVQIKSSFCNIVLFDCYSHKFCSVKTFNLQKIGFFWKVSDIFETQVSLFYFLFEFQLRKDFPQNIFKNQKDKKIVHGVLRLTSLRKKMIEKQITWIKDRSKRGSDRGFNSDQSKVMDR